MAATGESKATGPLAALSDSLQHGRDLLSGVAEVAALESRLAALSLTQMLTLAVVAALLACSAWGLALAALAFALARAGVPWLWLLPVMAVMNGLIAWWAWCRLINLGGDLNFQATRQLLRALPTSLSPSAALAPSEPPSPSEMKHEESPTTAP